tara:strand:- start:49006 stop:49143 length:138 start_codon:yes stop_codon:yes gene_type:complete
MKQNEDSIPIEHIAYDRLGIPYWESCYGKFFIRFYIEFPCTMDRK